MKKNGLRTTNYEMGVKHGLKYKMRIADYGLLYGLGIIHGLRYNTRTGYKLMRIDTVNRKKNMYFFVDLNDSRTCLCEKRTVQRRLC